MNYLFLNFKKSFLTLFVGMALLLGTQGMNAQKTTAQSGDWTATTTWVGGVVPTATELVTIAAGHNVTYALTTTTNIGSLNIANGAILTISGTASRNIGTLTVDAGGTLFSTTGATSLASASTVWTNNGTITLTTLGLGQATLNNNGTLTCGMGSTSTGTLNNNSGATLNLTGTVAGNINNFGTMNSGGLSGTAATAVINNKASGVFYFTGSAMSATNLVLNATEAGNTVNYSFNGTQTVKDVNYSNLIFSGYVASAITKTWPQSADRTVSGNLTINSGVTLRVSSASVSSVTITSGGSGYGTTVPTVSFSAPTAGATATGTAFLTAGAVSSIVITNPGSGYTTAPTITIAAPTSGTTATATATLATQPTAFKFTVNGTTTNSGTLTFDTYAGTGDKTFATFSNPGTITSAANASFIFASADYSGAAQTVLPGTYTNLTLSGSGTKTIGNTASSTLCTGKMTISGTAKASVTNPNVGVNLLFLGTSGQNSGTIGFTGSGATTINTTYFITSTTGYLNVQKAYLVTSTAAGGDWNSASTWVDGVVPVSADDVTIVGTATVNLTLSAALTVGALNIKQGGKLNVSASSSATNITFTLGTRSPGSTIAGDLLFDTSVFGGKTFGTTTVTATGSVIEAKKVSISVTNGKAVTNYGTITTNTLAPTAVDTNFYNYGTINGGGFSSVTLGTFTNYSSGTLNFGGTIAGNLNNYGTINASALSNSSVSKITNYSTGVINFTGQYISATNLVLDATAAGNTVNYSLAGDQTIKPITYSNLILSGSGSKNIALGTTLTIPVNGTVTVNSGVKLTNSGIIDNLGTITNNGDIVLKSSATGTGSLLSTSSLNNVTQQRYLTSNQRGWRLISNPLSSTTFDVLASTSNITLGANFTGEYLSTSDTWTSTDGSAAMDNDKAYKVFITGLAGESSGGYVTGPSNVTLINKGTAANTAPAAITTVAGKYYLVANPYTAPVSVANLLAASTGLSNTVSYYNPTNQASDVKIKGGGYDTPTVTGLAGSDTDVVIPAMGAIFVQATTNGSISIPKTAIFTGTPAQTGIYTHKTAQTSSTSTNALKLEVSSGGVYYDAVALQFKAAGDAGSNIDFGKLPNTILDAYSLVGTQKMAVSELELVAQTIPLGITSTIQKNFTFKVIENTIPSGFEAVLLDKVLNTNTVLNPGTNYDFAIDSTPASQGNSRFAINLKIAGSLGVNSNELANKIKVYPNPSRGQFNISNTLEAASTIEISSLDGQIIHSQKLNSGTTTIQTNSWATGVYILKATNNGTQITKKLVIQ